MDYILRIPKTTHLLSKRFNGALGKLHLQIDKVRDFSEARLGKDAKIPVRLIAKKTKIEKKVTTWYLATSLRKESKERVVKLYERRMGIEASFRDLKTTLGWRFEKQIQRPERITRYLLILVMTMILAWLTSTRKKTQAFARKVSLDKAFGQTQAFSFVQKGLWIMQRLAPTHSTIHPRKSLSYAF
jgi:hypothetical protein